MRGITYGPFDSGVAAHGLPHPDRYHQDLDQLVGLGVNTLRVTRTPTHEFLSSCTDRDLQVFITLAWEDFVDFFADPAVPPKLLRNVRRVVSEFSDITSVSGYFVGSEISAQLVRWMGPEKVKRFLEDMIDAGRGCDPAALFAYSNYPTTEYLNPDNADFVAYNVYLERREDFRRYLKRLHQLAGNRPLVISEFGLDSKSNSAAMQRNVIDWACEEMLEQGTAGTILFTFTDEWFTGGREMSEWAFGIVDRERRPKPAYVAVQKRFVRTFTPVDFLTKPPKISVIVCTYNGIRTLDDCLKSLKRLRYPDYEVLLIDDGSGEEVRKITKRHKHTRYIKQEHAGLSTARNLGAKESKGEILAYTDDDCMPDQDWLGWLALEFERDEELGAVGGPNLPPSPANLQQACVLAAPGAPSHVLLKDDEAEHIPGCNLSVRRSAFDAIGGFVDKYRVAGDDVDFCWRLQIQGLRIGFAPAAVVWHYRRFSTKAYLKQQAGYGRAEAILMKDHSRRFSLLLGGAKWFGTVYEPDAKSVLRYPGSRIFSGKFGNALFQSVYSEPASSLSAVSTGFPWLLLVVASFVAGALSHTPWFAVGGVAMLAVTARVAWTRSRARRLEAAFDSKNARLLLWFLTLAQPIVRGATRLVYGIRLFAIPRGSIFGGRLFDRPPLRFWKKVGQVALWSETGRNRDHLLGNITKELQLHGWKHRTDDGWNDWDVEIRRNPWWRVRLTTVTEYHRGENRLTRVRLASHMSPLNLAACAVLLATIVYLCWVLDWKALWLFAFGTYFLWWLLLEMKHQSFVNRCIRMILSIGQGDGFEPIHDAKDENLRQPDQPA